MTWIDDKMIAFDFETSGTLPEYALQPWRVAQGKSWVTSFAAVRKLVDRLEITCPEVVTREFLRPFLQQCIADKVTLVGWNTVFDIQWLLALGMEKEVFQLKWLDGMLLWRHYYIIPEYDTTRQHKKSYGLKSAVAEELPEFAGYEEDIDFHDPAPEVRAKLRKYNIEDTTFTLRLARKYYNRLTPQQLKAALIEAECLPLVAKANLDGMRVDTLVTRELQQRLVDDAARQLEKLAPHGVTERVVRSPKQLSTLIFDVWGLPPLKENTSKLTGKKTLSTDKEVLHELAFIDPRAKDLRLYREALNNKTKFADSLLTSVAYNEDGRTHPHAFVFGTYSGRFTYASKQGKNKDERQTGFALHQMKRDLAFRAPIIPPEGYTLVEFDASGQEFRWMAIAANDPTMLNLCMPGEDAHSYMGAEVTRQDYKTLTAAVQAGNKKAKDDRQLGKVANLSLQYRTSAPKLRSVARVQYNIPMELPQARQIHGTYPRVYKGVPKYWDLQIQQTKRLRYVETFAGRRVKVEGNWDGSNEWSMGSTAINYRIQGTGGDQKYLALAVIKPYLTRIGAYFAWDLHDGIYLYVPTAKVQRAAIDIKYMLDNLPYRSAWGFQPPIVLPWDCKVGNSWGTLKEVKI